MSDTLIPYGLHLICINSDETSEDVQAQMHAIQENELVQLHELTSFLDLEINFVQQYLNVLKDVKSDWHDECVA